MKKLILPLLLAAAFLFAGFEKAYARNPSITIGSVTPPSTPSTITQGSTVVINGTSVTTNNYNAGTATVTSLAFTTNNFGAGQNLSNYFATANIQLWYTTNGSLTGGAEVAAVGFGATSATVTGGGQTLTFSGFSQTIAANTTGYFYVVVTYNVANTTTNFELDQSNITASGGITTINNNGGGYGGGPYKLAQYTVTITSLTTTAGNNGTSTTPVPGTATNYAVAAFSLVGSGTTGTGTITSLSFYDVGTSGSLDNTYYTTAYVYQSASPTYIPGTTNVAGNLVGSAPADGNASQIITIPTTLNVGYNTNIYLFVVLSNTLGNTTASTFQEQYNTSTGTASGNIITSGAVSGPAYTFSALPPVTATATSLTTTAGSAGLSTPATISTTGSYTVYGMSLTPSATGTTKALTGLTFTTSGAPSQFNNYFYGTAYLYASNNSSYDGTAVQISTVTTAGNNTLAFTGFTTAQNITAGTTKYYYVVIVYSAGVAATATQTITLTGTTSTAAVTISGSAAGPSYTYSPITYATATVNSLTTTVNTSGLANSPIGTAGSYAVYGMSVTPSATGSAAALTGLTFTTSASPAQNNNYFYGTAYLYASTSSTFSIGTATQISTVTTGASTTLAFTGFTTAQTITPGTTMYYYVYIVYTAPGVASTATQYITYTSATSPAVISAGASVSGPTYTYNPVPASTLTYYWTGNGANSNWNNAANWQTNQTQGSYVNTGYYPGATTGDGAVFNSYLYKAGTGSTATPTITGYNVQIASLSIGGQNYTGTYYNTAATLTVNSADSLTTGTFTAGLAASGRLNQFNIAGTTSGGVIASLRVTGAANFNAEGVLQVNANGVVNFPSASSITFTGSNTYNGAIVVNGGLVTANNCAISFGTSTAVYGGLINVVSGNMSVNGGSVLTMNAYGPQIATNGGNFYLNSSTLSTPGTTAGDTYPDVYTNAGLFQVTNSTFTLNGSSPYLYNNGGTQTYLGSTLNFTATGGILETDAGTINIGGTTLAQASTINLGTLAAGTDGVNSAIDNYGDNFYLNAYSTINIPTVNSNTTNYNIYNGGGAFVCASTSTINPSSTRAYIANNSGGAGYFALLSDANGAATIGKLGTGAKMTGQYFVQRYISTASRNYRLLTSATNTTGYTPGTAAAPNAIGVKYLGQSATVQTIPTVTYKGAFVGGPAGTGGGFTAATGGPCLYLYQESILPNPANYNTSYYTGKNVAVTGLGTYLSTTSSVVASGGSGTTASDNGVNDVVVPPGNGYLLYYIGNNANTISSALNTTQVTNQGYINQGTIPVVMWGVGTLTTALTKNSGAAGAPAYPGLTMVGNPYPSSIDLQKVYTDNTTASSIFTSGTFGFFNTLDPATEQFSSYGYNGSSVTSSGTNPQRYVASGQGFYVTVVNAGKTLTFYEDQKTSTNPTTVLESVPVTNPLATVDHISIGNSKIADAVTLPGTSATTTLTNKNSLTLNALGTTAPLPPYIKSVITPKTPPVSANLPAATNIAPAVTLNKTVTPIAGLHLKFVVDSVHTDEVGVYFTPNGSDKYDANDALDIDGPSGKVYLSSYTADNKRTSINSLGNYTGGKQAKLFVKSSTAGIFQLQLSDIANIDTANYSVFLLDKLKADSLDLTLYKSYNFNYAPGTGNDSTRFVLAIEHKPVPYYALLSFAGQKVTPGVQLNWQTKNLGNKTTFVLQKLTAGNVYVAIDSLQSAASGEFSYVDQHPTLGNNTYRLEQINALGAITYSAPVTIGYNSTNPNGGLVLYPNPAKTTMTVTLTTSTVATQVATADIYNAQGKLVEHKVVNSNSFTHDVSGYELGVYIMQLKNSNGDLVGNSKFVKVN